MKVNDFAKVTAISKIPTIDELTLALSTHSEVKEANEWRLLAEHVQGIILGVLKGNTIIYECKEKANKEKCCLHDDIMGFQTCCWCGTNYKSRHTSTEHGNWV